MKRITVLLLSILFLLPLLACQKASPTSQNSPEQQSNSEASKHIDEFYKNWDQKQIKLDDGNFVNYYALIREKLGEEKSDGLLIYLDGSEYQSVMGIKEGEEWILPGNPYGFALNRFTDYDFLAIDKVNVTMGGDHNFDTAVINNYTFDNCVNSTVAAIDDFLENKNYKDVFIMGISEGGQILPRVYSQLRHKDKISKLVVLFSGGLSQYEDFKILANSDLPMEPGYKEMYSQVEEAYKDILENPESTEKQYAGHTYKRMYGFLKYEPLEDFMAIDIPILMINGAMDTNTPVESGRAVKDAYDKQGKSNLEYVEIEDMAHGPDSKEQADQVFGRVSDWLKDK